MSAEERIDIFRVKPADTRPILGPVCVVTHSHIILSTYVRREAYNEQSEKGAHGFRLKKNVEKITP